MAQWKKIVVSGSDANLNSLDVNTSIIAGSSITAGAEITAGTFLSTGILTASNEVPLYLPNLGLKFGHYIPMVYDSDSGRVFKGAPYSPAVGEGSPTVGVSGSLLNNVVVIGSGSGFVMTASGQFGQNVSFNSSSINTVDNITASGDISASGILFIDSTEDVGQDNYRVLLKDLTTGRVYHTSSYSRGISKYFQLEEIPEGIISNSLQFTTNSNVTFGEITASKGLSSSGHLFASLSLNNDSVYNNVLYNSESGKFFIEDVSVTNDSSGVGFPFAGTDEAPGQAVITGSFLVSGSGHITASGNISASQFFGTIGTSNQPNITTVGVLNQTLIVLNDISASGNITASNALINDSIIATNLNVINNITASIISASDEIITNKLSASGDVQIDGNVNIDGAITQEGFNFVEDNIIVITGSNSFGTTASANTHKFTGSVFISSSQTNAFEVINDATTTVSITPSGKFTAVSAVIPNITSSVAISASSVFGTLQTSLQPNITLLGTLSNLDVSGNITASGNISASGIISASEFFGIFNGPFTGLAASAISGSWQGYISGSGIISSSTQLSSFFLASSPFTPAGISGSWQGFISGSGIVSNSLQFTSQSDAEFRNITASIISASGIISASEFSGLFNGLFTGLAASAISGSWQGYISGSGIVSNSLQFTTNSNVTFGEITASKGLSSSGHLFASLSLQPNNPNLNTVLYDSQSGKFFFTGSKGGTGAGFPFVGVAHITGSLIVSGNASDITEIHTPLEVKNNVIIDGDLTVHGEATTINVSQLAVEDRFILVGSGSSALPDQDVGIIFDVDTVDGTGSVFFFDESEDRFAVGKNLADSIGINNSIGGGGIGSGTHAGFIVTTTLSENSTNPNSETDVAKFGLGELRILKNGDIYIYTTSSNE